LCCSCWLWLAWGGWNWQISSHAQWYTWLGRGRFPIWYYAQSWWLVAIPTAGMPSPIQYLAGRFYPHLFLSCTELSTPLVHDSIIFIFCYICCKHHSTPNYWYIIPFPWLCSLCLVKLFMVLELYSFCFSSNFLPPNTYNYYGILALVTKVYTWRRVNICSTTFLKFILSHFSLLTLKTFKPLASPNSRVVINISDL